MSLKWPNERPRRMSWQPHTSVHQCDEKKWYFEASLQESLWAFGFAAIWPKFDKLWFLYCLAFSLSQHKNSEDSAVISHCVSTM